MLVLRPKPQKFNEKELYKMSNRTRKIRIPLDVTPEEKEMIKKKMEQYGTDNMSGYIRKMAIDGYVIKKDYSELKDLIYEIGKIGTNINQIAKRVNTTSSIYEVDVNDIKRKMDKLWQLLQSTLLKQL